MNEGVRQRFEPGDFNPLKRRKFELTTNLTKGSSAYAQFLRWDKTQAKLIKDGKDASVTDDLKRYGGVAGEQGEAEWDSRAGYWRVVEMYRRALWIVVTLNGALLTSDANRTCTVVSCHEGLSFTDVALVVYNELGFAGSNGATFYAIRKDDGTYQFFQGVCT